MSMTATTRTAGHSAANAAWIILGALGLSLLGIIWGFAVAVGEVAALLLCAAAIACLFVLFDFRVGVVLLILAMPVSGSAIFPHQMFGITGLNPLNLVIAATFFSFLLRALSEGGFGGFLPRRLFWLYLAPFAVAGVMGVRHAGEIPAVAYTLELVHFNNAFGYVRDVIARPLFLVLFALLLGAAAARSRDPRRFIAPLIASVWLIGVPVIAFVFISGAGLSEMSSAGARTFLSPLGIHANELGRLFAVAYALLLFTCVQARDFALRGVLIATMLLVVAALALTFSRGAFVGFVVVNALFLFWRRTALTWIAAGFLIALLAWKLPGAIQDRITMGFDSDLNSVSAGRIDEIWIPLLPTFWESPWFGHGLSSILWSAPLKSGQILEVSHPHNAYLQTLLDMGIVGLVLVGAFFVQVWRGLWRLGKDERVDPLLRGLYQGAAAGLLGFAVAATGGSSLTPAAEQCFLWFAIGMMWGQLTRRDGRPA
jgi:O-antigen ligase